jgi:hypothetical protein
MSVYYYQLLISTKTRLFTSISEDTTDAALIVGGVRASPVPIRLLNQDCAGIMCRFP